MSDALREMLESLAASGIAMRVACGELFAMARSEAELNSHNAREPIRRLVAYFEASLAQRREVFSALVR